jgi:acyl CoA:acetate/3-ketoacid CoA transferase alpha subunit/acyl CoA:acetate/3-ketoacid CoA transferase beta subunit
MIPSKEGMAQFVEDIMESRFALPYEEGRSKVIPLDEAIQQNVQEGMSIHLLGLHYRSHAAIYELFRQFWNGQPDFTIVAGTLHGPIMTLFHAGIVKKAVTAFVGEAYPTMGPNPVYNRIFKEGHVSFENWSFLTFTLRLLAGAMGVGFLPTRSLVGSDMAVANEKDCRLIDDPFGEVPGLAAVRALNPDITLLHGHAADKFGNTILMPPRGEDIYGVFASRKGAIVTVEKIVSTDFIRQNSHLVRLPGSLVRSVSEVPMGAHPSGLNSQGLSGVDSYSEDIPFYVQLRKAAKDTDALDAWIKEWILSCKDRKDYFAKLGNKRVHLLKGRSHQNAWLYDLNSRIPDISTRPTMPSPLERAVLASAEIIRNKIRRGPCKLILAGAGLASLAAWVAIYGLKEEGTEAELMSELGFFGFSPRPGEPFLFNLSNMPTCKELDGILTILGIMMSNRRTECLGTLSAAQVDRFGNLNTTVIPEKKMLITGSGGANDVMSAARDVVVIMPQSKKRFIEKLPFITSPGSVAGTLVSTLGIFEKLGDDREFTLTSYFEDQLPKGRDMAIREIRAQCGWDLRVMDRPTKFPLPDSRDLATLRMFDPDRYFLRD